MGLKASIPKEHEFRSDFEESVQLFISMELGHNLNK